MVHLFSYEFSENIAMCEGEILAAGDPAATGPQAAQGPLPAQGSARHPQSSQERLCALQANKYLKMISDILVSSINSYHCNCNHFFSFSF